MKYNAIERAINNTMSHPSRGAWIEMPLSPLSPLGMPSRTPHGVRGLKFGAADWLVSAGGVAPLTGCVD